MIKYNQFSDFQKLSQIQHTTKYVCNCFLMSALFLLTHNLVWLSTILCLNNQSLRNIGEIQKPMLCLMFSYYYFEKNISLSVLIPIFLSYIIIISIHIFHRFLSQFTHSGHICECLSSRQFFHDSLHY